MFRAICNVLGLCFHKWKVQEEVEPGRRFVLKCECCPATIDYQVRA